MPANNPAGRWTAPKAAESRPMAAAPAVSTRTSPAAAAMDFAGSSPRTPRGGPWLANFFIGTAVGIAAWLIVAATTWGMGFLHLGPFTTRNDLPVPSSRSIPSPSTSAEDAIAREKKALESSRNQLALEIAELKQKLTDAAADKKKLNDDKAALESKKDELEMNQQTLDGQLQNNKKEIKKLNNQIDALTKRVAKAEGSTGLKIVVDAAVNISGFFDGKEHELLDLENALTHFQSQPSKFIGIHGIPETISPSGIKCRVSRLSDENKLEVVLKGKLPGKDKEETIPVAVFRKDKGKIQFQWKAVAANRNLVDALLPNFRNSVLELKSGQQSIYLALRKPVEFDTKDGWTTKALFEQISKTNWLDQGAPPGERMLSHSLEMEASNSLVLSKILAGSFYVMVDQIRVDVIRIGKSEE
jgi:hypothetical protein